MTTALWILAAVLGLNVLFVAYRLWVTRNDIPEEQRAARRAELAARFDTYAARIDQLPIKGE
ncbi:hypothetical protein [Streptomyces sp. NRRL S-1824]|uniref:hypothetical protein n=1 Tax=Streptomyces sp. NRRL S-1824 TaxID=1463889 RepID=UPI0004C83712|nr:hypothetical protein [Streptomyces sp. NRRL S-1824]